MGSKYIPISREEFDTFMKQVNEHPTDIHWKRFRFATLTAFWKYYDADDVQIVGRFENFREDSIRILSILTEVSPAQVDAQLGWERKTNHKHYRKYYTTKLCGFVERWDAELIDRFQYHFEGEV